MRCTSLRAKINRSAPTSGAHLGVCDRLGVHHHLLVSQAILKIAGETDLKQEEQKLQSIQSKVFWWNTIEQEGGVYMNQGYLWLLSILFQDIKAASWTEQHCAGRWSRCLESRSFHLGARWSPPAPRNGEMAYPPMAISMEKIPPYVFQWRKYEKMMIKHWISLDCQTVSDAIYSDKPINSEALNKRTLTLLKLEYSASNKPAIHSFNHGNNMDPKWNWGTLD